MTYRALTEQEKDQLIKQISLIDNMDGKAILKIMTDLALEFNTSIKVMIELCFVNIALAFNDRSKKLTISTLVSKSFNIQGIRTKHIALLINGNPTRVLILSETETIVKLSDVKETSIAMFYLQDERHSSALSELYNITKNGKPTN